MVPRSLVLAAQGVGEAVKWRARAPAGYDPDVESANGPPKDIFEDLLVTKPGARPWVGMYVICVKGEYKGWIQIVKDVRPYDGHLDRKKWPSGIRVHIQTSGTGHNQEVDFSLLRCIP
jgi:hypothetical protein